MEIAFLSCLYAFFDFSPTGKTIRSKVQLIRYLGGSVDLTDFDYQTGKILTRDARHARSAGRQSGARNTPSPGGTMRAKTAAGGRSGHHTGGARGQSFSLVLSLDPKNGAFPSFRFIENGGSVHDPRRFRRPIEPTFSPNSWPWTADSHFGAYDKQRYSSGACR